MNLTKQLLNCQQDINRANNLTDADVANIKAAGLRLVNRPEAKANVVSLDDRRVMNAYTSPEAA